MKKEELKEKLIEIAIPENLYNLDGSGRKDERFCIELIGNLWHVYFSERGIKTADCVFHSEDQACQYLYEQLTN